MAVGPESHVWWIQQQSDPVIGSMASGGSLTDPHTA
jgi:hypothetical protein